MHLRGIPPQLFEKRAYRKDQDSVSAIYPKVMSGSAALGFQVFIYTISLFYSAVFSSSSCWLHTSPDSILNLCSPCTAFGSELSKSRSILSGRNLQKQESFIFHRLLYSVVSPSQLNFFLVYATQPDKQEG